MMNGVVNQYKKEAGLEVDCFAGFCQHCLATTSAHTHVYHYPLFKENRFVNNYFRSRKYSTNIQIQRTVK